MNDIADDTHDHAAPAQTDPKRAVPVMLFLFVFSLIVDNAFKFTSKPIADDLGLSITTVSLQATLAGLIIGIGAVVYATLADSVDMRSLLLAAIGMICVGSLVGFVFRTSFPLVLTGRIVQTAGLAAAETLYVIYVTKFLPRRDQKTYLGFSTSAFQLSLLFGALASGFISDYISWTALFLVPLASLLAVPSVLRYMPRQKMTRSHLDVLGLGLIAVIATCILLFLQAFDWRYLVPVAVAAAVFARHVTHHPGAIVDRSFFADRRYMSVLLVVFVMYTVQLGYSFMFPFLLSAVYGFNLADTSLLLVPGYVCAVTVGALSGKIATRISSTTAVTLAIALITAALALPAVFMTSSVAPFVVSMMAFASGFALMYAPLVATAIRDIPAAKSGVAIGFYNLTINVAVPIGIAYTAKLVDLGPTFFAGVGTGHGGPAGSFATIMLIIAGVSLLGLVVYRVAAAAMTRADRRADTSPTTR